MSIGIILIKGPTGSGKSTSLYAFLSELNTPFRRIVTEVLDGEASIEEGHLRDHHATHGPRTWHESRLFAFLRRWMRKGDLLVADRGFWFYVKFSLLLKGFCFWARSQGGAGPLQSYAAKSLLPE